MHFAVLKDIINKKYGTYKLMLTNYGDNFRETSAYENNDESLFEIQFLDYGSQGTDDEWTPVNTQCLCYTGSAIESNFGPATMVVGLIYQLHLGCINSLRVNVQQPVNSIHVSIGQSVLARPTGKVSEYGNTCYTTTLTATDTVVTNNNNGGLPIAKFTNLRTGLYSKVVTGLHDGINLRMMRYSDVLLRAAECENEVSGPTQQAIDWINQVR